MVTPMLVALAPLSIILLPLNIGVPVAGCLVAILIFREWGAGQQARRAAQKAKQQGLKEGGAFRDSVSEYAKLAVESFRQKR